MVQPATESAKKKVLDEYNRFEKWFNPQRRSPVYLARAQYNRFEKWFNPQQDRW